MVSYEYRQYVKGLVMSADAEYVQFMALISKPEVQQVKPVMKSYQNAKGATKWVKSNRMFGSYRNGMKALW